MEEETLAAPRKISTDADRARVLEEFHGRPDDTAAARLRAFEDTHFGKDVPRINGEVERGVGSRYADMTPHHKAHHASLEHLVRCEKAAAHASAALADAEAKHEAAKKASHEAAAKAEKAATDSE